MSKVLPKLFVMVGLPGSGKSTIAEMIAERSGAVIVASDKIREELGDIKDQSKNNEVFKIFHTRVKDNLLAGKNVIADATNIKLKSRTPLLLNIKNVECIKIAYVVATPIEICLENNRNRDRSIPDDVIYRMRSQFEIPFLEEGFDRIKLNRPDDSRYRLSEKDIYNSMFGFDQKTPYHLYTLEKHCNILEDLLDEPILKRAAAMHDYGKTLTQTIDENRIAHYYQHHNVGAYELLTKLYCDMNFEDLFEMMFYINWHMLPFQLKYQKTHEKYKRIFGETKYNNLIEFNRCDKLASGT